MEFSLHLLVQTSGPVQDVARLARRAKVVYRQADQVDQGAAVLQVTLGSTCFHRFPVLQVAAEYSLAQEQQEVGILLLEEAVDLLESEGRPGQAGQLGSRWGPALHWSDDHCFYFTQTTASTSAPAPASTAVPASNPTHRLEGYSNCGLLARILLD